MDSHDPKAALQRAIDICGSQSKLAEKIGCNQPDISYWLKHARRIPAERCQAISDATAGEVTPHALNPDAFKTERAA